MGFIFYIFLIFLMRSIIIFILSIVVLSASAKAQRELGLVPQAMCNSAKKAMTDTVEKLMDCAEKEAKGLVEKKVASVGGAVAKKGLKMAKSSGVEQKAEAKLNGMRNHFVDMGVDKLFGVLGCKKRRLFSIGGMIKSATHVVKKVAHVVHTAATKGVVAAAKEGFCDIFGKKCPSACSGAIGFVAGEIKKIAKISNKCVSKVLTDECNAACKAACKTRRRLSF